LIGEIKMETVSDYSGLTDSLDSIEKTDFTLVGCHASINKTYLAFDISDYARDALDKFVRIYSPGKFEFSKKTSRTEAKNELGDTIKLMETKDWSKENDSVKTEEPEIFINDDTFKSFENFKIDLLDFIKRHPAHFIVIDNIGELIPDAPDEGLWLKLKALSQEIKIPIMALTDNTIDFKISGNTEESNVILLPDTFTGVVDRQLIFVESENEYEYEKIRI